MFGMADGAATSMLREPSAAAQRFSAALAQDVARALRQAGRPMARTLAFPATNAHPHIPRARPRTTAAQIR